MNVYLPTATVSLVNFPGVTLTTSAFSVTVRLNCEDDTFTNFEWTSSPLTPTDFGYFVHVIDADNGSSLPFNTVTGTILGCTPSYYLFVYDGTTGNYVDYFDSNASIDNIALFPQGTPDIHDNVHLRTSVPTDAALDY